MTWDARTATEFGTLRSFIRINADSTSSGVAGGTALDQAYIQFAGMTAGRITSFFSFWGGNMLTANNGLTDPSVDLFAYTATFGGGFSATVSVEDPTTRRTGIAGAGYGGRQWPDLVANVNVAQAWGSAQVMAAIHQVRHNAPAVPASDRTGWAVGAGVTVNLPMLAAGSAVWLQGTYADGAVHYAGAPTAGRDFTVGVSDATVFLAPSARLRTTKAWSIVGGLRHFWTPAVWSDFQAGVGKVDQPVAFAAGAIVPTATAQDYTWYQLGTRLNWRPVAGLTFSGDVVYTHIDPERRVQFVDAVGNVRTRGTTSTWAGRIRVQRDF